MALGAARRWLFAGSQSNGVTEGGDARVSEVQPMDSFDDELRNLFQEVGKALVEEDRKNLRIKLQQMVEVFSAAPPEDRESPEFRQGVRDLAIVEMFSGEAAQLLLEIERECRGQALTEQEALRILSKTLQERADLPH